MTKPCDYQGIEVWREQDDNGAWENFGGDEYVHLLDYGKVMVSQVYAYVKIYTLKHVPKKDCIKSAMS